MNWKDTAPRDYFTDPQGVFDVLDDYAKENARLKKQLEAKPKVKPLVWTEVEVDRGDGTSEPTGDFEAESPFGLYFAEIVWRGGFHLWDIVFNDDVVCTVTTPEEVKAQAQADYERRILDTLEAGQ